MGIQLIAHVLTRFKLSFQNHKNNVISGKPNIDRNKKKEAVT